MVVVGLERGLCLHALFREQARETPDNVALVSESKSVDYKTLDGATDQLAAMLLRHGVGKDSIVGILMERCNEYALSYVGIHKAGGAYLPLDVAYPDGLLKDVLADSKPVVVLCKRAFVTRLPEDQAVILLDSQWDSCLDALSSADEAALASVDASDLDSLAYVVYSSGTTGKPKGIACPHRGAVFSYGFRLSETPYLGPHEVEACNVFFVWEMMRPLLAGQTLCVVPDDVIYDPPALSAFIEKMRVTRMLFTPSLLEAVLDCKSLPQAELARRMRRVNCVLLCGEVVMVTLQERAKAVFPAAARLVNLYSVSECHDVAQVDLAKADFAGRKYCPVGKLIPGVEAVVLDDALSPRALGEEGELYVAGPTLARCYLGLAELNKARFPVVDGRRLYKTGDRARVLPNRDLEILGRCDSMQKIRGYSVELRAIEAAVMALSHLVTSCVVVVQGEEGEDKFVVGYVVLRKAGGAGAPAVAGGEPAGGEPAGGEPAGGEPASCRRVRRELKAKLPHYMVPSFLVELEELPTHAVSGKLDKKLLPPVRRTRRGKAAPATATATATAAAPPASTSSSAPESASQNEGDDEVGDGGEKDVGNRERAVSTEADCTAPRSELEEQLHELWCEAMDMQQIDVVFDSFFDIGGHSLLAAALVASIKDQLGRNVGVVDLFGNSTIEELAAFLEAEGKEGKEGGVGGSGQGGSGQGGSQEAALAKAKAKKSAVDLDAEVEYLSASNAVNDQSMRAFWRSTRFARHRTRSVLLTGATGFLGSFLLRELLRDADVDVVYCVVRQSSGAGPPSAAAAGSPSGGAPGESEGEGDAACKARVVQSLKDRGLWEEALGERVQAFAGDVALHHLGLDDDSYAALSTGVDVVVHCAALVNLVYPYAGLRSANVMATRNAIEFALHGKVKRFAYVSTDGIFPPGLEGCAEDADVAGFAGQLRDGYSQSKWVAERLVQRARDCGLPTVVFRPGNMGGPLPKPPGERAEASGDAKQPPLTPTLAQGGSAWNALDFNFLFLTGCIELGAAPDVEGWLMEMTPVDVAVRGMVGCLRDPASLGRTFHVTNFGNCLPASQYLDAIRNAGHAMDKLGLEEWKERLLSSSKPSPTLARLRGAVVQTSAEDLRRLSTCANDGFVAKCLELGVALPVVSPTLMHEFVEGWQQSGIVKAPAAGGRPLRGKVALVLGASSGIGAAIAAALSDAGAAVGLGGRRLERLQQLQKRLAARGAGNVTCCAVDVTDRAQVKAFVATCEAELGPTDIFVNNAGVMHYTLMKNGFEDQWAKEVDVNCKGVLHSIGAVLPGMRARGRGHFIATSSDAGRKVFPGLAVYSGTKFFLEAVCQGLRLESAEAGVKVTTIQPGDCKSELSMLTTDEEARKECAQDSDERKYWLDPEDVARAVVFAATAPPHVAVNEVLVEPTGAPA